MKSIELPGFSTPVAISSILWLQSEANYTRIYYLDNTNAIVTKPINYFVKYSGFVQVHRSTMVNFMYVQGLVKDKRCVHLELSTGRRLTVSRPYQPLVNSLFGLNVFTRQEEVEFYDDLGRM
ncbi:LytTR family DNA-binding domain-containing protein [Spirosoma validum]|uniref:LytTR family transcriptional regulator n=1 Tax=Spirosoma validum TaxID=2771355 RepID=A0A927B7F1_9BACT|nr:LytTR family DNA-binding domain-containing protein [Spirosoma validum]MBD2756587.1 LytTR family transcriptional regulator [Spirosoma validum]